MYAAVGGDTGQKVGADGAGALVGSGGGQRLSIVLEAARIVSADITSSQIFNNFRQGDVKSDPLKVIPNTVEYARD